MASESILIKNGTVFNGKGDKGEKVDILIEGEKIKKIGKLSGVKATKVIDASGKYVSPGFIDLTNHSDTNFSLFTSPAQESLWRQGITTILGGNCGVSLAPLLKEAAVESFSRWMDTSKVNINWQSVKEFLKELKRHKIGVNFCTLVGYDTVHKSIVGDDSKPDVREVKEIKLLIKKSFSDGAFGVSFNLGSPSAHSMGDEGLKSILDIVKKEGALAKHHLHDEGKNILPALSRLIHLARESGARTNIAHCKALGKSAWGYFPKALKMISTARADGLELFCDFFPFMRTGSNLFDFLPLWVKEEGRDRIFEILNEKESDAYQNLLLYLQSLTLHYDKITIASTSHNFGSVGKTIAQISNESDLSGEEIILELLKINKFRVSIFSEAIRMEDIKKLATQDYSVIASDGKGYDADTFASASSRVNLPHPRSFGAFPRAFSLLARTEVLSWEETIYKMTGFPAKILGIKDRGIIAPGNYADIVIFDPEEIECFSSYNSPYQFAGGVEHLFVNGRAAQELAGKVISK